MAQTLKSLKLFQDAFNILFFFAVVRRPEPAYNSAVSSISADVNVKAAQHRP
jgi:hypothetical protein